MAKGNETKLDRGYAPDDVPDEVVREHAVGSGSWWSDPDATSTDPQSADTDKGAAGGDDDVFSVAAHTVDEVVAHATANPDQVDNLLAQERSMHDPRTTLINKLEAMKG